MRVYLYDGVAQPWFSAQGVAEHLTHWLPWAAVAVRGDLLTHAQEPSPAGETALAERLCQTRVLNPVKEVRARRLLKPEVAYEERLIRGESRSTSGVLYDGNDLQRLASGRLAVGAGARAPPPRARGRARGPAPTTLHVWFTERLFATWDDADRRYHARVILAGMPAIVSTTGMTVAPARERAFYLARRLGVRPGPADASEADFLRPEDPRTTEVGKGYAMQAVFYTLLGEPFCDDPRCRLFNAHWQREMLAAQLSGPDYCPRHTDVLEAWQRAGGAR